LPCASRQASTPAPARSAALPVESLQHPLALYEALLEVLP